MSRVYIPNISERYDPVSDKKVPVFDYSDAARFGALVPVLESGDNPYLVSRVIDKIKRRLEAFGSEDYLLASGDPAIIAACAGILMRRHDCVKMLKWDNKRKAYIHLEVNLK